MGLRQLGIPLQNHHDTFKTLPFGAQQNQMLKCPTMSVFQVQRTIRQTRLRQKSRFSKRDCEMLHRVAQDQASDSFGTRVGGVQIEGYGEVHAPKDGDVIYANGTAEDARADVFRQSERARSDIGRGFATGNFKADTDRLAEEKATLTKQLADLTDKVKADIQKVIDEKTKFLKQNTSLAETNRYAKERIDAERQEVAAAALEQERLNKALSLSLLRKDQIRDELRRQNAEQYDPIIENAFLSPLAQPLSTFSIDVDTASYANMRRFLTSGRLPPPNAVRIEELVNYFRYDYPQPKGKEPFSVNMEVAECPWQEGHLLLRVGLKGKEVERSERPASNLVFLLDVSGSMADENKLPLLKTAMKMLVGELGENDRVSIVTYAGDAGLQAAADARARAAEDHAGDRIALRRRLDQRQRGDRAGV